MTPTTKPTAAVMKRRVKYKAVLPPGGDIWVPDLGHPNISITTRKGWHYLTWFMDEPECRQYLVKDDRR